MVQSTAQQRRNWAPACKAKGAVFIEAMRAKDTVFKAWNYPTNRSYTGCYSCRPITGGSGYSLHAYGPGDAFTHWDGTHLTQTALAEDVNASQNPYGPRLVTDRPRGMVDAVLAIRTNSGAQVFGWGGYYRVMKDAMHDDIVCTPAELASGIDWSTVAGPPQPIPPQEDQDMLVVRNPVNQFNYFLMGDNMTLIRKEPLPPGVEVWATDVETFEALTRAHPVID